jgi:hypothetical protein
MWKEEVIERKGRRGMNRMKEEEKEDRRGGEEREE